MYFRPLQMNGLTANNEKTMEAISNISLIAASRSRYTVNWSQTIGTFAKGKQKAEARLANETRTVEHHGSRISSRFSERNRPLC